ncbi:MAG: hypothetical protein KGS45_10900 [Planctomycetes bacterium]|nr:hypothetical protein [Planctomycetota bacterium]
MKTSIAIGALALVAVAGSANAGIVDSFTTAGNSSTNGFGAPWVNIPGSLFNQRQVARFNSAGTGTASVASGAWNAFLPQYNTTGSPSSSVLTYRQDSSFSTIDLSGIASMSFDIAVTGSVTFFWNIMDVNGFIIDYPGPFTLSAGSSTQTLNFSTANIDLGFDISAVNRMQIWISAASANSSISVTNFTYTLVPTPGAVAVLGLGGLVAARRRR